MAANREQPYTTSIHKHSKGRKTEYFVVLLMCSVSTLIFALLLMYLNLKKTFPENFANWPFKGGKEEGVSKERGEKQQEGN